MEFPETQHEIQTMMMQTTRPSSEWWDNHLPHLTMLVEMSTAPVVIYLCNFETKDVDYLELIRCVCEFGVKYFQLREAKIARYQLDYEERLSRIITDIYQKTANQMDPDEYQSLLEDIMLVYFG